MLDLPPNGPPPEPVVLAFELTVRTVMIAPSMVTKTTPPSAASIPFRLSFTHSLATIRLISAPQ
jgi:hypothetical protein